MSFFILFLFILVIKCVSLSHSIYNHPGRQFREDAFFKSHIFMEKTESLIAYTSWCVAPQL